MEVGPHLMVADSVIEYFCVLLQPQYELMARMWEAFQTVMSEHGGPHAREDIEKGKILPPFFPPNKEIELVSREGSLIVCIQS